MKKAILAAAIAACAIVPVPAFAAGWTGGSLSANLLWSNFSNWEGLVGFDSPDTDLIFGQTPTHGAASNVSDMDVSANVKRVAFFNNTMHVRDAGGRLTLAGPNSLTSGFSTVIDVPIMLVENIHTWTLFDSFTSLSVNKVTVNGTLAIKPNAFFGFGTPSVVFAQGIDGSGAVRIESDTKTRSNILIAGSSHFSGGLVVRSAFLSVEADDGLGTGLVELGGVSNAAAIPEVSLTIGPNVTLPNNITIDSPGPVTIAARGISSLTGQIKLGRAFNGAAPLSISHSGDAFLTLSGGLVRNGLADPADVRDRVDFNGNILLTGTDSTYRGNTTINGGTLVVDSTFAAGAGAGPFIINDGATLAGHGTINDRVVNALGRIDPGSAQLGSAGTLHIGSDLALGGIFHVDLPGDKLVVGGDLSIGGSLEIGQGSALSVGQNITLIEKISAGTPTGSFSNFPPDGFFPHGNLLLSINYAAGAGNNDVVLSVVNTLPLILLPNSTTPFIAWANPVDGNFDDNTLWDPQFVPNQSHGVLFDLPATAHITTLGQDTRNAAVVARGDSRSTLDLAGNTYRLNYATDNLGRISIAVGTQSGDDARFTLQNGRTIVDAFGVVDVGRASSAQGMLTIRNDGTTTSLDVAKNTAGIARAGVQPGSTGIIHVEGGPSTSSLLAGTLIIGDAGHGELHITGNAYAESSLQTVIGNRNGGVGLVRVSGNNAEFYPYDFLIVGPSGAGTLIVENSAYAETDRLTVGPNGTVILNSNGTLEVDDSATVQTGGSIRGTGGHLIVSNTLTNNGTIAPGLSPGTLSIEANLFEQGLSGVILLEAAGTDPALVDHLMIDGNATIGGTIRIEFLDGFLPKTGDSFSFITATGQLNLNSPSIVFPQLEPGFTFNLTGGAGGFTLQATSDAASTIPVPASWNISTGGSWNVAGNWSTAIPDAPGAFANFADKITDAATITLDGNRTVGRIAFANANSYTIAGPGSLTLDNGGSTALIQVNLGNHRIDAPLIPLADVSIDIAGAASLTLTSPLLLPSTAVLHKTGTGALNAANVRGGSLDISAGRLSILANGTDSGASAVDALTVSDGATLDLNDNSLIIHATIATRDSVLFTLSGLIASARNGAVRWTGAGITSSIAAADVSGLTGLGVILNDDGAGAPLHFEFDGQPAGVNDLLIKYTWNGDTDLSGVVDADDYFRIDSGFASAGALTGWRNGDFDYSGETDADDYFLIDSAFASQSGPLGGAAAVPEPGRALCTLSIGLIAAGRRRRVRCISGRN